MEEKKAFETADLRSVFRAENLYRFVLAILYALIAGIFLGKYIRLPEMRLLHLITGFLVILFTSLLTGAKGRMKVFVLLFLVSALILTGALIEWENVKAIFLSYPDWLFGNVPEEEGIALGAECIQAALLALVCFGISAFSTGRPILKAVIAGLLLAGMIVLMFLDEEVLHFGCVLVLVLVVMSAAELLRKYAPRKKRGSGAEFVLWLTPVFLIYGVLIFIMPTPEKPYDWAAFRNAYTRIEEGVKRLSSQIVLNHGSGYTFSFSGFSEDASLGGNVRTKDQENLRLSIRGGVKSSLYFAGRTMDTFDGKNWVVTAEEDAQDYLIDAYETYLAVNRYDPDYYTDYLRREDMDVTYLYIKTDAIFLPQKTASLTAEREVGIHGDADGNMYFEGRRGYGTSYHVKYSRLNLGTEYFRALLETPQEPYEEEFVRDNMRAFLSDGPKITAEDIEEYHRKMRVIYRKRPELSAEVREYLDQALEGTKKGSVERLYRIEELLSSYTYDAQPGRMPRDVKNESDFLDYFLLEKRSGYCSYFSTAFVLLARYEGYPARYVQGFLVPPRQESEVTVMSSMSHAWPEVYFEGIGWIPFEPTPGFAGLRYDGWGTTARKEEGEEGEYAGGMQEYKPWEEQHPIPEEYTEPLPEELEEAPGIDVELILRALRAAGLALAFLVFALILLLLLENLVRRLYVKHQTPEKRFVLSCERLLRLLAFFGASRKDTETLHDLDRRASELLELDEEALRFLADYEALTYGGAAEPAVLEGNLPANEKLLFEALREKSRVKCLLFRMFYG